MEQNQPNPQPNREQPVQSLPIELETQTPIQPNQMIQTKSKQNLLLYIIILILLATIFGLSLYIFQIRTQSSQDSSKIKQQEQVILLPSPTPLVEDETTSNWKIYTDNTFGYSLRYPDEKYSQIICPDNEKDKFMLVSKAEQDPITSPTCSRDSYYFLEITPNAESTNTYITEDYAVELDEIKVSGLIATKQTIKQISPTQGPLWYQVVTLTHNSNNFSILYHGGCANDPELSIENCKNEFDQILSTFEFTEEMGQMCGGIAAIQCPEGYTCMLDGDYPDAGGTCISDN